METWDAIRSRRNIRHYLPGEISSENLDRILQAGWRTPSSRNEQRWDFVVCTDRRQLTELSGVWRGAWHVASSAATIAIVAPTTDDPAVRESIQYDLGQLTMAMMLAATDLGIGTGHAYVENQGLARRVLGLPQDRFCAWLLALGYPADRPLAPIRRPNRRPFEDVVRWERWLP